MCTRSFRGGETGARPRPRFPGLARLNHAQQLQRSPASSQLSKISREDPPPLRGGTQAPTDMSAVSWNHLDYRVVKICCLFFCFFFVSHYTHAEIMHVTCTHTDPVNMCGCVLWKTNASCFPNPVWLQSNLVILTRRGKYRITVIEESGIYYLWERGLPTVTITMLIQAC